MVYVTMTDVFLTIRALKDRFDIGQFYYEGWRIIVTKLRHTVKNIVLTINPPTVLIENTRVASSVSADVIAHNYRAYKWVTIHGETPRDWS